MAMAVVIGGLCLLPLPETSAFQQQTSVIIWDERRPLTWADFRGTPDDSSGAAALVITSFTQAAWECAGQGRGKLDGGMLASMDSSRSWVKPRARGNAEVLNHEQGHFHITEIFPRRTRTFLRGIECARPSDVITRELNQGFQALQTE